MTNRIVIPTGYMGSGSSAIGDLLAEYEGFDGSHGDFEFVFLHCPGGLFDLEDKLLSNNNAIRSDEALHAFLDAMAELDHEPLWWVGGYRRNLSPRFMEITERFVDSLTQFRSDNYWYHQEKRGMRAFPRLAFNKVVRTLSAKRIVPQKPLRYQGMMLSLPTPEEFYAAAQGYLAALFEEMGLGERNLILDQLLLPFNLGRMDAYLPGNADCIVAERDPRDVFAINKYVWGRRDGLPIPYPTDAAEFCAYYRRLRAAEKVTESPHVHRVRFEDLVYRYEEAVQELEQALGLQPSQHLHPKSRFDPARSIENTQLFRALGCEPEAEVIAAELPEYLYDFPYERTPQADLSF